MAHGHQQIPWYCFGLSAGSSRARTKSMIVCPSTYFVRASRIGGVSLLISTTSLLSITSRGELNIGQLCRQRFGEDAVALIGMGTHAGTVAAASDWDGDLEIKRINPSHQDSYERQFHDAGVERSLTDLSGDGAAVRALRRQRLERFIGVIYRPETELMSHYAQASLSQQFDSFLWFDETTAVTPLGLEHREAQVPDTYPFGL